MMRVMSVVTSLAVLATVLLVSCANEQGTPGKTELTTLVERASYAMGLDVGRGLKRSQADVDVPSLFQGIKDAFEDRETLMTPDEAAEVMTEYSTMMREKTTQMRETQSQDNVEKGAAFLDANKGKPGVITTESGLQYMVVEEGDGPKPKPDDTVSVNYQGTLIDGTEFDSSYTRGQPATFPVGGVIPGWTEGLQLMNVGSTYRLFIPPELGYGDRGAGPIIGPHAVLIFEVELLEIVK